MDDFDDIQCEDYYGEEPEWLTYNIGDGSWPMYRIVCSNTVGFNLNNAEGSNKNKNNNLGRKHTPQDDPVENK